MMTKVDVAQWLLDHDRFLILTHRRPDGDTLGSAALLCRGLRSLGKQATILENEEITEKYAPLHQGLTKKAYETGDTVICVDIAAPELLPDKDMPLLDKLQLRIDHHGRAASFAPAELVQPEMGACGEIIYEVLIQMGVRLDKPMAEALYTAVSTDTGCFRYANTTAHSLMVASACYETGADLYPINQALFDTVSLARLKVQGWMSANTRFFKDGTLAVCPLPRQVEQDARATEDDLENISGFPRSIEGVKMAATLRETGDGQVKISVRAVPGYDASAVCAKFGGGGHKGAAGASLQLPLEEAAQAVARAMLEVAP